MMKNPLKILIVGSDLNAVLGYTTGTIRYFLIRRGVECYFSPTPTSKPYGAPRGWEPDIIFYSVFSPGGVFPLLTIRSVFPKKPIIVGGFAAFKPDYLVPFADAVVVGEGYRVFKEMPMTSPEEAVEWIKSLPNAATLSKIGQRLEPDYEIPWSEVPEIRLSKFVSYYLAARGCRFKCAFCMTSWVNPYQVNPLLSSKVILKRRGYVYLVGNDIGDFPLPSARSAASVSCRRFLQKPHYYVGRRMLHIGIEGFSEKRRLWYGKPIKNTEIRQLFSITKKFNQPVELFFILQAPVSVDEFYETLPNDLEPTPRVLLKLTYLMPTPYTPLDTYDFSKQKLVSIDKLKYYFSGKNERLRFLLARTIDRALIDTLLFRMNTTLAAKGVPVLKQLMARRKTSQSEAEFEDFKAELARLGFEPYLSTRIDYDFPIRHPNEALLQAIKKRISSGEIPPG